MRRLLALALFAATACGPTREEVVVNWTFGSQPCAAAGVATIQVDIAGQVLTPNQFTCAQASVGADLGAYLPGTYQITVTGLDGAGTAIYQTTQNIVVRGNRNVFTIDAVSTSGSANIAWTFGGKSCAAAGVTVVNVNVDGQPLTDAQNNKNLPCSQNNLDGLSVAPLLPGQHSFDFAAYGASNSYYARSGVTLTVNQGQDTSVSVDVPAATPTTAGADVSWTFSGSKTCAQVGVDHVYVVLDPAANGSGGTAVGDTACAGMGGAPVTGMSINGIASGQHSFAVRGAQQNTLLYYTHQPVSTQFFAGLVTRVAVDAQPTP